MDENRSYLKAIDDVRHEKTLLFDRLNFFLAGSAFLITAYAALAVSIKHWSSSNSIILLTYILNGTGLYLAIFFAVINYLNTRLIEAKDSQIHCWESNLDKKVHQKWESNMVEKEVIENEFHRNPYRLIWGPVKGLWTFLMKPFHLAEAPHTYILPLGLTFFCLVVFFFVFPINFPTLVFFLAPLILILGFFNIGIINKNSCKWIVGFIFAASLIFLIVDSSLINYYRTYFYIGMALIFSVWIFISLRLIRYKPTRNTLTSLESEAILFLQNDERYKNIPSNEQLV